MYEPVAEAVVGLRAVVINVFVLTVVFRIRLSDRLCTRLHVMAGKPVQHFILVLLLFGHSLREHSWAVIIWRLALKFQFRNSSRIFL